MYIEFYSGNQLENLIARLAEDIKNNTSSPFDSPTVIVQSQGMMKWISLEIARRNGICANVKFRFPKEFIYDCFHKITGTLPEESLYEKEVMTWKIMELLPKFIETVEFSALRAYLKRQEDQKKEQQLYELKEYQLCEKIASLFDQYLIFRPQWIIDWQQGREPENGEDQDKWQGILWRALEKELGEGHPVQIRKLFIKAFDEMEDFGKILPKNIYMFGISSLPDFYIGVLDLIATKTNVRLYHMNPSREFWGDINRRYDSNLLASMGILGRDFSQILLNNNIDQNVNGDLYSEAIEDNDILSRLQKDIFELADPAYMLVHPEEFPDKLYEKHKVKEDDRSLEIHSCHSTMREVEVLYDNLLDMFSSDPELKPADIIVMAPDIETYAPYIDAVFGTATAGSASSVSTASGNAATGTAGTGTISPAGENTFGQSHADTPSVSDLRIPYSIADRSIRRESQIIDTFLKILDMINGRLSSVEVMGLLEVPAILRKFGISEGELESIQNWVRDTQIRWGKDSESRAELGLPETEDNTWEAGFKRLFLGYAMPGNNERFYGGILPYDNIEGMDSVALGKFYEFVDVLSRTLKTFKNSFTLSGWTETLNQATDDFFMADYLQQPEINTLRNTISELKKFERLSKYEQPVDISLIVYFLKSRLEKEGSTHGFLKRGVTFCSMLPMRSIPFKIICLTGMNHDAFPRESKSIGFDLMKKYPALGDRSKRLDDRYLFLESIISARKKLYISFVGQSIKDNSSIPPSVLVSELIDYIQSYFRFEIEDKINTDPELLRLKKREREKLIENKAFNFLITRHKLQAFNPEYFKGGSRLFSYSGSSRRTAENYIRKRIELSPIGLREINLQVPKVEEVTIDELINFFSNPSKHFLQRRLEIYLRRMEEAMETSERFEIDALMQTILGNEIVGQIIKKKSEDESKFSMAEFMQDQYRIQKASGMLPHGSYGKLTFDELSEDAAGFAEMVMMHSKNIQPSKKEIEITINGIKLTGSISSIFGSGLIHFRFAKTKARDRIRLWINFLALNASSDTPFMAKMICKGKKGYSIQEADMNAIMSDTAEEMTLSEFCRRDLSKLLGYYRMGLGKPLKFFPETSWAYYEERVINGKDPQAALKAAQEKWAGFTFPECADIHFSLCFGEGDIFDSEFEECALDIFGMNGKYLKESGNAE